MNFQADGRAEMKNLLGGKGANLAEMASIGLPVPPGFTLTTEVCTHFYQNGCQYPKELEQQAGLQHNPRQFCGLCMMYIVYSRQLGFIRG